ncbi:hypothetical protein CHS0354_035679 [Potamilus streckersoni]|uniref:Uncharacterized protein n=1 Tax=Potamilus streckersoni TaxID=2493646 RepID=A0AAE0RSE4_9BIVA|nr:hypothetical protein CHS0354_035679 [Potamilus streckersoni]
MSASDIFTKEIPTDDEFIEEIIFDENNELKEDLSIEIVESGVNNKDVGNKVVNEANNKQGFGIKNVGSEVDEDSEQGARHNKSVRQDVGDSADINKYLDKDSEELYVSNYDFNGETDDSSTNKNLGDTSIVKEVSKLENSETVETGYPNHEAFNGNVIRNTVEKACANDSQTKDTSRIVFDFTKETSSTVFDVTENLVDLQLVYQNTTDSSKDFEFKDYVQGANYATMNDGTNVDIVDEDSARLDHLGEEAESFVEDSLETGRESRGLGGLADDEDSELDPDEDRRDVDANTHASLQSGSGEEYIAEDDEDRTEMSLSEMRDMYNAVKAGNIDCLEDCLDKRCSDINMTWYSENLLMAAIRAGQQEMAEFLLDNGVDYNYVTSVIEVDEVKGKKRLDVYSLSCRQLALDYGLLDIAEIIDEKNGDLFNFVKPKKRVIHLRRPKPPTPTPSPQEEGGILEEGDEEKLIDKNSNKDSEATELNLKDMDGGQKTDVGSESGLHTANKYNNLEQGRNSSSVANSYTGSISDIPRRYGVDEGYETMSPKSSPSCSPLNSRTGASDYVSVRGTKASISLLGYTRNRLPKLNHQSPAQEIGVTDKKVETVGSYAWESKFWHRKVPKRLPEETDVIENTWDRVRTNSPWVAAKNDGVDQCTTSDNVRNGSVKKLLEKDIQHKSKSNRTGHFVEQSHAKKRWSLPNIVRKPDKGNSRINCTSIVPKISYSTASRTSKFGPYGTPLNCNASSPSLANTEVRNYNSPFLAKEELFTRRNKRR